MQKKLNSDLDIYEKEFAKISAEFLDACEKRKSIKQSDIKNKDIELTKIDTDLKKDFLPKISALLKQEEKLYTQIINLQNKTNKALQNSGVPASQLTPIPTQRG